MNETFLYASIELITNDLYIIHLYLKDGLINSFKTERYERIIENGKTFYKCKIVPTIEEQSNMNHGWCLDEYECINGVYDKSNYKFNEYKK